MGIKDKNQWLIDIMIWLRLVVVILVTLMLLVILFFLVLGEEEPQQDQTTFIPQKLSQIKNVPGIQSFIRKKSKPFNKVIAIEVDTCAICIDEFEENDGRLVAELNCDERHIFHVECL